MRNRLLVIILCLIVTTVLSACGIIENENKSESNKYKKVTKSNITFEIKEEYDEYYKNNNFYVSTNNVVYGFNGESVLGGYEPEEFLEGLVESYKTQFNTIQEYNELKEIAINTDTEAYNSLIEIKEDDRITLIEVLIIPNKNKVITYEAQYSTKNKEVSKYDVKRELHRIVESTEIIGNNNILGEEHYDLSNPSDSNYADKYSQDDKYTDTYKIYYGQEAFDNLQVYKES